LPLEYLESESYIALCIAVKKWDPHRSPLTVYARLVIENHLKDFHTKNDNIVYIPESSQKNIKLIREAIKAGITNLDQVAKYLGMNKKVVIELWPYIKNNAHEDINDYAYSLTGNQYLPESELEIKETQGYIRSVVSKLPPQQRKVIELRFGFTTGSMHTTAEIAKRFHMRIDTVQRLETEAQETLAIELNKLRQD